MSPDRPPGDNARTHVDFLSDAEEIERRPTPRLAHSTVHLLAAFLVAVVVWASVSEVDEIVVTRGRAVNPDSNIVVQPLETAIVQSLDVRIGQVVRKGQQLARLDPTFAAADEAQLTARLSSLDAQFARLTAEVDDKAGTGGAGSPDARLQSRLADEKRANYASRLIRLDEQVARLEASLATNRRDQQMLEARVKSLREIEAMQERLIEERFGARLKLLESRDKRLEVERDQAEAVSREAELKRELAGVKAEREAFRRDWRQRALEEMVSVKREQSAVAETLQKAGKKRELVTLLAPADAVVLDMAKRSVGSIVREAEPLLTLVPLGGELEAEVQIDTADIGYVKVGDKVRIKIDAFPFQKHGTLDGVLRTLSQDAFARDRAAAPGQTDLYYLGRVAIGPINLRMVPKDTTLIPGMTLTAEIVVGKRTVMSYFLYPIIRAFDEAIREP